MQEMHSRHFAQPVRANQYSVDGQKWQNIPAAINVLGSRYALVINGLRREEFELPLDRTRVAVGNSQGRSGDGYLRGHVDKACLEVTDAAKSAVVHDETGVQINLIAELMSPYAVYVRNRS